MPRTGFAAISARIALVGALAGCGAVDSETQPSDQATPAHADQDSRQAELPFTGIMSPNAIAVDAVGDVYLVDGGRYGDGVLLLPSGSSEHEQLPFEGLEFPNGVALDSKGNVYVSDAGSDIVAVLPTASAQQRVLPFDGSSPTGVAVDTEDNVYVALKAEPDTGEPDGVVVLAGGSGEPVTVPGTEVRDLYGVAVDAAGNIYFSDCGRGVFKVAKGTDRPQPLPFVGVDCSISFDVDREGSVYAVDRGDERVVKLPAGSQTQETLPFAGIDPAAVDVDSAGNVYVADEFNRRVLVLPTD